MAAGPGFPREPPSTLTTSRPATAGVPPRQRRVPVEFVVVELLHLGALRHLTRLAAPVSADLPPVPGELPGDRHLDPVGPMKLAHRRSWLAQGTREPGDEPRGCTLVETLDRAAQGGPPVCPRAAPRPAPARPARARPRARHRGLGRNAREGAVPEGSCAAAPPASRRRGAGRFSPTRSSRPARRRAGTRASSPPRGSRTPPRSRLAGSSARRSRTRRSRGARAPARRQRSERLRRDRATMRWRVPRRRTWRRR